MAGRVERRRHRLDLDDEDHQLLGLAAERFDLPRSEVIRRLLRGALDAGPALSGPTARALTVLGSDIRAASRTLARLGLGIKAGEVDGFRELGPIVDLLHRRLSALEGELTAMTLGHGRRLRRAAGFEAEADAETGEGVPRAGGGEIASAGAEIGEAGSREGSDGLVASAGPRHDA